MRLRTGLTLAGLAALSTLPLWAGGSTFTTADPPATILDTTGLVACQTITVPSSPGEDIVGTVTVQVATTHTFVGDLTYRLNSPSASDLMLQNRAGRIGAGFGNSANLAAATPITFDDAAVSAQSAEDMGEAPVGTTCASTTTVGTTCGPTNYTPAPDAADTPIPGLGTNLAQYTGTARNGVWTLCVADSVAGDTGALTSWSLTFANSTPVELLQFGVE